MAYKRLFEDENIISLQRKIKRVIENYLDSLNIEKGDVYKAAPTIIRGTPGKTQRKITYSGKYKIYITKGAWDAVELYWTNPKWDWYRKSSQEQKEFIDTLENNLNKKFNKNTEWFDRKEFPKRLIITEEKLEEIFGL